MRFACRVTRGGRFWGNADGARVASILTAAAGGFRERSLQGSGRWEAIFNSWFGRYVAIGVRRLLSSSFSEGRIWQAVYEWPTIHAELANTQLG